MEVKIKYIIKIINGKYKTGEKSKNIKLENNNFWDFFDYAKDRFEFLLKGLKSQNPKMVRLKLYFEHFSIEITYTDWSNNIIYKYNRGNSTTDSFDKGEAWFNEVYNKSFVDNYENIVFNNLSKLPDKLYLYSSLVDVEYRKEIRYREQEILSNFDTAQVIEDYWDGEDCGDAWAIFSIDKSELQKAIEYSKHHELYFQEDKNSYSVMENNNYLEFLFKNYISINKN